MKLTNNVLKKMTHEKILDLSIFIVEENLKSHFEGFLDKNLNDQIQKIFIEEMHFYKNSQIFVVNDKQDNINGVIRVLKWNFIDELPIQKLFGINPLSTLQDTNVKNIFHIGRFAIIKTINNIKLLKSLMVAAIAPVCENKKNIAFAECDSKLLRVLTLIGIKSKTIGKSINYLGSETIPILMDYNGLIEFYNANKMLISHSNIETNKLAPDTCLKIS